MFETVQYRNFIQFGISYAAVSVSSYVLYNTTSFSVNSAVKLLSRDSALIRNDKSTLFACFKTSPFMRWSMCAFSEPVHLKHTHEKASLTALDN